jgi:hypothetical protein
VHGAVKKLLVLATTLAACGDDDPCAAITGTCVALTVDSDTIEQIDQLELDVLWDDGHGTTTTTPGGGTVALPVATAIAIDTDASATISIVAAGKLSGSVLGTGAATAELAPGAHGTVTIHLAPPEDCVAGSNYCGGDKLAGDPDVLYVCNAGGVPIAQERCANGCTINPGDDDSCAP